MTYTAEIIGVGTELLLGNITNTDAQDFKALSEIGVNVYFHTVVGDNPERLKQAVAIARSRADIIIQQAASAHLRRPHQTDAGRGVWQNFFNEDEAQKPRLL